MGDLGPTDLRLMQGLAQQVMALRPELVNADATVGELAWVWGKDVDALGPFWRRRMCARRIPVACLGAPAHPAARNLYLGVGFREFTRDLPEIKLAGQGMGRAKSLHSAS